MSPFESGQVRTASYDLRLGADYLLGRDEGSKAGGQVAVQTLEPSSRMLEIPPNQVVVVRCHEVLKLKTDHVGHLSLKLDVLMTGLIMASQSQIDAGYKGPIFALLYNLSDQAVTLKLHQPLLRLEFATLDRPTAAYAGSIRPDATHADVLDRAVDSSLFNVYAGFRQLERDLRTTERTLRRTNITTAVTLFLSVVALFVTLHLSILAPFISDASKAKDVADRLDAEVAETKQQVRELESDLARVRAQVEAPP